MPRFSIVIPLYNKEKDFPNTLKGVMDQTLKDFEVIIVNDGSTDNSLLVAQSVSDARIKVYHRKNEGVAAARNFGVAQSSAKEVVFLDADDYWYPWHLENIAGILKKFPKAKWYGTSYEKKYNERLTRKMVSPFSNKDENWIGPVNFYEYSLADSAAHPSSAGMKKSFFTELGGYNTKVNFSEDTDLWIRAALREPLIFSNKTSAVIVLDSSNRANSIAVKTRAYAQLEAYEPEGVSNPSLKRYLDVHYFSIALNYKLAGDKKNFKRYRDRILLYNLNGKQRLFLKMPRRVLKFFKTIKNFLHQSGMYFSVYR